MVSASAVLLLFLLVSSAPNLRQPSEASRLRASVMASTSNRDAILNAWIVRTAWEWDMGCLRLVHLDQERLRTFDGL